MRLDEVRSGHVRSSRVMLGHGTEHNPGTSITNFKVTEQIAYFFFAFFACCQIFCNFQFPPALVYIYIFYFPTAPFSPLSLTSSTFLLRRHGFYFFPPSSCLSLSLSSCYIPLTDGTELNFSLNFFCSYLCLYSELFFQVAFFSPPCCLLRSFFYLPHHVFTSLSFKQSMKLFKSLDIH